MTDQTVLDYARPNQQKTTQQLKPIPSDIDAKIANALIKMQNIEKHNEQWYSDAEKSQPNHAQDCRKRK